MRGVGGFFILIFFILDKATAETPPISCNSLSFRGFCRWLKRVLFICRQTCSRTIRLVNPICLNFYEFWHQIRGILFLSASLPFSRESLLHKQGELRAQSHMISYIVISEKSRRWPTCHRSHRISSDLNADTR